MRTLVSLPAAPRPLGLRRYPVPAPWDCPQGAVVLRYPLPEGLCLPAGRWGNDSLNGTAHVTALREEKVRIP